MRQANVIVGVLSIVFVGCAGAVGSEDSAAEIGASCGSPSTLAPLKAGDELVVTQHPARTGERYLKRLHIGENAPAFEAVRHTEGARDPGQTIGGTYEIARPRCLTSDRMLDLVLNGETARFAVSPQVDGSLRFEGAGYGKFSMKRGTVIGGDADAGAADASRHVEGGSFEAGSFAGKGEPCSGTEAGVQCAPGLSCGLYDTPGAGGICIER